MNLLPLWWYQYIHDPPQVSLLRSSAAQTIDGNLRVRAPGFRPSASPLLGATLRAQPYPHPNWYKMTLIWKWVMAKRLDALLGWASSTPFYLTFILQYGGQARYY